MGPVSCFTITPPPPPPEDLTSDRRGGGAGKDISGLPCKDERAEYIRMGLECDWGGT